MRAFRMAIAAAVSICSLLSSTAALAWGKAGHEAVAEVAAGLLTDKARSGVVDLLGGQDAAAALVGVATWADDVRMQRPDSRHWHYVNIPATGQASFDRARDCPKDDCVVGAVERFSAVLADRSLLPAVRAEALRWLVHFVADVHQPLHAGERGDRGGNEVKVRVGSRTYKLHAWWDSEVVDAIGDQAQLVAKLKANVKAPAAKGWASGSPEQWATDSARVSAQWVYGNWLTGWGPVQDAVLLPPDYVPQAATAAEQQLAKAAVRLAATLNAAFH